MSLAKECMTTDFLILSSDLSLVEAQDKLRAAEVEFGVFVDGTGDPVAIVSPSGRAPLLVVGRKNSLHAILNTRVIIAQINDSNAPGLVVINESGRPVGIVTKATLIDYLLNEHLALAGRLSEPEASDATFYGDYAQPHLVIFCAECGLRNVLEEFEEGQTLCSNTTTSKHLLVIKKDVFFSCYWPNQVQACFRRNLFVYAHTQNAIQTIEKDIQKFIDDLGGTIPKRKTAKRLTQLEQGTAITVVPECDEIEFNPTSLTKKWEDEWVRFVFDFKPATNLVGDTISVRISIQVDSIEIAHVKCSIEIIDQHIQPARVTADPKNPLIAAKLNSQVAKMYQKIFVSYSRKDKEVVETYRLAQLAIGNDVFMDTYSIRAGENWQAALANAIDTANIFQLFWSDNSAKSPHVRDEWDYALKYKCPQTRCEGFIRPVYWVTPIPAEPPAELKHLNFRYIPLIDGDKAMISILFVAAEPADTCRLRLGEELREIQEKLQLAKLREQFELQQRMSVRPADISQALLDVKPQVVHFSGHGTATGALCFENQVGETHPIQPEALAALFEQFADQVDCVVLNACYSETQANAIAQHIDYVIGMNQAIGDKAAIAFAVGFYQALGAGRTIEDAYKLGCVQIGLQGIPEHLPLVLIKRTVVQP